MKKVLQFLIFLCFPIFITPIVSAQVVINEISQDPGNNDGSPFNQTGEFIELYNAGVSTVSIGGWMLLDNDAVLRFPSSATIQAGQFLLISTYGLDSGPGGTGGTGISCQTCDFNGIMVDYNWGINNPNIQRLGNTNLGNSCPTPTPTNPSGNNPDCSGAGNRDENWLLLDITGNIIDAVYYGEENNPCGVSLNTYNLPSYGSLSANTVSAPVAPFDGTQPIVNIAGATGTTNSNNVTWRYAGPQLNGCNSSLQRIPDGGAWANGAVDNYTYPFGTQPTTQATNHPTPGAANTSVPFTFSVSGVGLPVTEIIKGESVDVYTLCSVSQAELKFTVNNFQNVQRTVNYANGKVGSFVRKNYGTAIPFTSITPAVSSPSGTTILSFTETPSLGTNDYEIVWADYILNCCGSASFNTPKDKSSCSWECYERKRVRINIVAPLVVSKTSVSCPTDFTAGTLNIASLVTGGYKNNYELFANSVSQGTSSTGIFALPNTLASPITVVVSDGSSCSAPITVNINANCVAAPICPRIVLSDATANCPTTPSGNICPNDTISLGINVALSANLPNNGTIEWFKGSTATFNPYASPASDNVATSTITYSGGVKAPGGAGLGTTCSYLSGIFVDACGGGAEEDNEFIVLQTGSLAVNVNSLEVGFPGSTSDITLANTTDFTNAFSGPVSLANLQPVTCPNLLQVATNGGTIPANSTIILFPSSGLQFNYDFSSFCGLGTVYVLINNQDLSSATYANYSSLTSSNGRATYVNFGEGCGGNSYTYARSITGWTGGTDGDYITFHSTDTVTQSSAGGTIANASLARFNASQQNNGCATPDFITPPTVSCSNYTVPASECSPTGNTFYIKGIISPQPNGLCIAPNNGITTTAAGPYTVTCPIANLSGNGFICNGSPAGSTNLTLASSISLNGGTAVININDVPTNFNLTGTSPYSLPVSAIGTYELISITPPVGICGASVSGIVEVKEKNPPLTLIQGGCVGPTLDMPTIMVYPSEAVNDSPVNFCLTSSTPVMAGLPICNTSGIFTLDASTSSVTVSMTTGSGSTACTTEISQNITTCTSLPPLPLNLLSFEVEGKSGKSILSWKTVQEKNSSRFEIEHSENSYHFTKIGMVGAIGEASSVNNYSFTHNKPVQGVNYYRLKIIDADGNFNYSSVLKQVFDADHLAYMEVSPNPSDKYVEIRIHSPIQKNTELSVVDVTGKLMLKKEITLQKGESKVTLNLEKFASGAYYIQMSIGNKNVSSIFIKK